MNTIKLSRLEPIVYGLIFISSIFYSLIKFYQTSNVHLNEIRDVMSEDFQADSFLSRTILHDRPLDITDLEWQVFKQYYLDYKILYLLSHSIGFQFTKRFFPKHLSLFIIFYSTLTLGHLLSIKYLTLIYLNISFVFIVEHLQAKIIVKQISLERFKWIVHYLIFIISITVMHGLDFVTDRKQNLLIQVAFCWLNSKLLSSSIDFYEEKINTQILIRLAYLLYFPPFFFGPIYHYSDFKKAIKKLDSKLDENLFEKILQLFKYILWALFLETILHYFYSSAYQFYVYLTESFSSWSLCGFGYCLMILFYVKYFVIYGISRQLSIIDGFNDVIADPPECIGHMHQTSYLWRKFDRGLYLFLLKYFYKPLTGSNHRNIIRKFFAGLICFTIIALWHGYYDAIIVWVLMNIFLSTTEMLASNFCKKFEPLSQNQRLKALFGSPYLAFAYISNIFFLSNYETGMLFVTKILFSGFFPLLTLLSIFYCGCYICQQINNKIKK